MSTPYTPLPLVTLHLGARSGERIPAAEVAAFVAGRFESFTLQETQGWFRDTPDPGWAIAIASSDLDSIAALATALRDHFAQQSIGVHASGHYLRHPAGRDASALAAALRRLQM